MSVLITENRDDIILNQFFKLTLRAHLDLTGATMQAIIIEPDGTEKTHVVTVPDITAGYVLITFIKNELDQLGPWKIKLKDTITGIIGNKTFTLYINDIWEN